MKVTIDRHTLFPAVFIVRTSRTDAWHIDSRRREPIIKYEAELAEFIMGVGTRSEDLWVRSNRLELLILTGYTVNRVVSVSLDAHSSRLGMY